MNELETVCRMQFIAIEKSVNGMEILFHNFIFFSFCFSLFRSFVQQINEVFDVLGDSTPFRMKSNQMHELNHSVDGGWGRKCYQRMKV